MLNRRGSGNARVRGWNLVTGESKCGWDQRDEVFRVYQTSNSDKDQSITLLTIRH